MNAPHKAGAGTAVPASSISSAPSTPVATAAPQHLLTRRVRLVKQHIHAGLPKRPGEEIELLHDIADWLVAEGAAQEIESEPATPLVSITVSTAPTSPAPTPVSTPKKEK